MSMLINKKAVRKYALEKCVEHWKPHSSIMRASYMPVRVSEKFYQLVEACAMAYINEAIKNRPNKGVTL
jgi:hypothetical protein